MPDINLSPYTSQMEAIQRRQKMAELLSQQALQPIDMPQVAGARVSPYAGLAKMLQAYTGRKMREGAQAEQKTLADQYRTDTSADFSSLLRGLTPTAAVPEGPSTFTPNVSEMDMAQNPRMVMQPETDYEGGIIEAGQPGAGYFGVTPGTPAIPASGGRLTPEGFAAMKTDAGRQQYMAQLLAQIKPKEPIKLGKDDVLLDPITMKPLFQPEAKANFGSINPSQYTPESIAAFTAGGGKDFSLLRAQPNLSFQNTGTNIQPFDSRTGLPVGTATPIGVSPNTAASLAQARLLSDRAFNGLSANQKAQLSNEAKRLNISAQQLFFDTGMQAGGGVPNAPVTGAAPAQPANRPAGAVAPVPGAPVASAAVPNAPALSPRARQELEKSRQLEEFKGMNEVQSNAALFGGSMAQAQKTISELEKEGTVKNAIIPSVLQSVVKLIPFGPGEQAASMIESIARTDPTSLFGPDQNQQRLGQAQIAFATAWLRKTSGAAFGGSEIANTIKEYFPLIGEGEAVIKQKAESRNRAIEGLRLSTGAQGKAYIDKYSGTSAGGASNDPFGLRNR
jgi:hypothetical protein